MRTINSIKIAKANIIFRIFAILLGFVNRTFFLKYLGVNYLGINGLFSSVLGMLTLLELGLGSSIVYNLYKPVHDNNLEKISSLVNYFKVIYRYIALLVFLVGLSILPFIKFLIKDLTSLPFSLHYIQSVYLLSLLEVVSSYLFIYRTSLLIVDQKSYVLTYINLAGNTITFIFRLIFLIITGNFIIYIIIGIVFKIINNIFAKHYTDNKYPYLEKYKNLQLNKIEKQIVKKDAKNLSIHSIAAYVVNSTDSLIISTFVGVSSLGLLSNYSLLFSTIKSLLSAVTNSIQNPLGDLVAEGDTTKVLNILKKTTHMFFFFASFCSLSLVALSSDFIFFWLGSDFLISNDIVIISSINIFIWTMTRPLWNISGVTGLFQEDRINAILEAISNLIISLILVKFLGITGVFIGTACSYIISFVLKTRLQFNQYFKENYKEYLYSMLKYSTLFTIELVLLLYFFNLTLTELNIISFITKCFFCLIVPNAINYVIFIRNEYNNWFKELLPKLYKGNDGS